MTSVSHMDVFTAFLERLIQSPLLTAWPRSTLETQALFQGFSYRWKRRALFGAASATGLPGHATSPSLGAWSPTSVSANSPGRPVTLFAVAVRKVYVLKNTARSLLAGRFINTTT